MKKKLLVAFALALLAPWAMRAQECTQTVPYSEDFESYTGTTWNDTAGVVIPTCWLSFSNSANTSNIYLPRVVSGTGSYVYYHGAKSLAMTGGTTATYGMDKYVLLPPMNVPLNQLQISFWMCTESNGASYGTLHVGYVTSDDTSTFVSIASYPSSTATYHSGNGLQPDGTGLDVELLLSQVPTTATRLAFRWEHANSSYHTCCIDDIVVSYPPTCFKPVSLEVKNVSHDEATVAWANVNQGGSSYLVYYSTSPSFSIDTLTPEVVSDTTATLTNLQSLTTYYFLVVADCGGGDLSLPSVKKSFTTKRDCGSGYVNLNDPVTQGTSSSYTYMTYNYNSSSYALGHTANIFTAQELVELGLEGPGSIGAIKLHAGTTPTVVPMRVYIGKTALSEFSAATDTVGISGMTLVFDDTLRTAAGEWVTIPFTTPIDYSPDSNLMVYFYRPALPNGNGNFYYTTTTPAYRSFYGYRSASSTANLSFTRTYLRNDIAFDICYEEPSCIRPANVSHVASTNSITLTWDGCANANEYVVTYGIVGGTATTTESTSQAEITIENLTPGTDYSFAIRSICGSDTTFATLHQAQTECAVLAQGDLPWLMNFEGASVGTTSSASFVNCMTRHNSTTSNYPYVSSTASYCHSGVHGLYWYCPTTAGAYQVITLPEIDTNDYEMNTLQVRFWARATGTSYSPVFQVGVMTHPDSLASFQPVATINVGANTTYTEYIATLSEFQGHGNVIAIRGVVGTSSWYASVDDITLEPMPNCPPVNNIVAASSVGGAVLTWGWQAGYEAPGYYEVVYDSIGGTNPTTLNVTTNSATLLGLTANTTYKAYVQADCGAEGLGQMDSVEFSTGSFGCAEFDTTQRDTVNFSNSTTGTSGCIANSSWGNTAYQTIYTAAELTAAGLSAGPITGIDLGFTASTTYAKEFTIFMGNTSTTSISNGTFENPQTQVYGPAAHPLNTSGWQHYDFVEPFIWDGTSSIIMTTFMNQPTGVSQTSSSGLTGYYVSAANTARYRYKDSSPFTVDGLTTGTAASTYSYRAAIHFHTAACTAQASCANPAVLATPGEAGEVDLLWTPGYDESSWNVDYRIAGDTAWTSAAVGVSTTSYTATGLLDGTSYEFRVWFDCAADNNVYAGHCTAMTACMPKALPYTMDFENATGTVPNCWDFEMTGTSTYQAATYWPSIYTNTATTSYAHGNKCLRLYGVSIVSLPEVNAQLDSLRLTFTDTITSASYGLIVGVMEDGVFVPVDTVDLALATRNNVEVFFHNYQGNSRTIALRNYYTTSTSTYTSYHYIDDIVVEYIPVCSHPVDLEVADVTTTSVTLSWSAGGDEIQWTVTGSDGSYAVVGDTFAVVNGLTANTNYTFDVRALCAADDSSESVTLTARTGCDLLTTVPFFEDFESYPTYSSSSSTTPFIPCWTRLNNGTTYGGTPYVGGSTYNHTPGGSKGVYWYAATTATTYGDYQYIILPQIDTEELPINELMLSFWAKSSGTSYNPVIQVGVMNSNTDTAFQAIETININGVTTWTEHIVSFAGYDGNDSYIAIRALRPSSAWYLHLDDVTLDLIPACPRVENVVARNVLLNSATISWTDTSDNSGWKVEYDTVAFTPGTNHMTAIHVTDTFALLTGLDSATRYHVYVYPDCGTDVYYRHITFNTLAAAPATVPYSCDFEAEGVNGWDFVNGSQVNYWMVGNAVSNGGNRSLYITNNDSSNAYTITTAAYVFATRTFDLAAGHYVCSFDWKAQGESSFDFIRAALVPDNVVLTAGEYCGFDNTSGMPTGGIALDGAYRLNLESTWQTQVEEITVATPGIYKMVFLWRNDPSGGTQPPAAIDNVSLILNTCPRVSNVTADLTSNSINLAWTPVGTENSWELVFGGTTVIVNTPAYNAVGLTENTDYTVSIRPICGVGDTGSAHIEVFHTPCVAVSLPYDENFDSITTSTTAATGVHVDCWNYIMTGTSTYQAATYQPQVYYSSTYAHSGSYSLRLYGVSYTMLPPMPVSLDSLQLTFWDYTTSTSYGLEVGVMEGNTFVPIQTINSPTSTHVEHTVYFGTYTGNSRIIAFRNVYTTSTTTYTSSHYIDNVNVDYLPTCPPVVGVAAVGAGVNTITLDWTDQTSSAQSWQVRYGLTANNMTTINTTTHPVTINGLDTLTSYLFSVRPICSATDTGNWSNAVSLSTELCDGAVAASTGNATSTSYTVPVNNYYKYSLSETIIDSAELAGIGDITTIAYEYAYATASTSKTNVTIWLQPTTKSVFSSSSDIVLLDTNTAVQVYHGSLNCSQGWNYFTLDTAYNWDGHSNLLVIVDDNSNAYNTSSYTFRTSACTGYKTLLWYSDSNNPDPTSSTYSGSKTYYQYRPTMKLVSCGSSCRTPEVDTVIVTETTATVNFRGSASEYEVAIVAGAWNEPSNGTLISTQTYTFDNLTPNTRYVVGVRAVCGDDFYSEWYTMSCLTDVHICAVPTNLTATNVTLTTATLGWTNGEEGQDAWQIAISGTGMNDTIDVTTNPYTISNLSYGVTYTFSVRAVCTGENYSEWSAPQTFTTLTCQTVTGVTVSDVTTNSAVISWTAPAGATNFEVEYGPQGFQQGTGTRRTVNDATTYTITGLADNSFFDAYVRTICGEGVASDWSTAATIHTAEVGIDDVASANVSLYPNPASSTVTLTGIEGMATVTVVDMNGRESGKWTVTDGTLTIDVTEMAQGAYFVRIVGEQVNVIRKLIVR